jgi:hypothetical protein
VRTLSPREKRLIAFAILAGLVVGVWQCVLWPTIDGFLARDDERQKLIAEYQSNERILAGLPGWSAQAREQARTASFYAISAPNESIAIEILSQRLTRNVTAAGGSVVNTVPVPEKTLRGWIHVKSDMELTVGQLYAVLTRIQNEVPYVVVGHLAVDAHPGASRDEPQSLSVRMDIFAAVRFEGSTPSPRAAVNPV